MAHTSMRQAMSSLRPLPIWMLRPSPLAWYTAMAPLPGAKTRWRLCITQWFWRRSHLWHGIPSAYPPLCPPCSRSYWISTISESTASMPITDKRNDMLIANGAYTLRLPFILLGYTRKQSIKKAPKALSFWGFLWQSIVFSMPRFGQ